MPSVDKTTKMQVLIPFSRNRFCGKFILKLFYLPKCMKEKLEDLASESTMDKTRTLNSHCKIKKISLFQSQSCRGLQCLFVWNACMQCLYVWDLGLAWCCCAPKSNSFLTHIVSFHWEKNHIGYHFPIFSFNKTNFRHRCENMLPSLLWCWWTMVTIYMLIMSIAILV